MFSIFDVLCMYIEQCLYVNKSLNDYFHHIKWLSLKKIWIKPFDSYELLQSASLLTMGHYARFHVMKK